MGNPEKLATYVTQDEEKQYKKHNAICVGHHITQANINNVNKTRALPQIIMIIPISFISWLVGRICIYQLPLKRFHLKSLQNLYQS